MYEKLSRDYQQYPLKRYKNNKLELPLKKDVELLFNYYNLTLKELGIYFNISNGSIGNILLKYGIKKDNSKRISKIKKTKLERYGNENYNNREKMKKTNIKLFGVDSFSKTNEYKEKTILTNKEKYGCDWVLQNKNIKEKSKKTKLERYGNENYVNVDKRIETNKGKYGLKYANQTSNDCFKYKIFENEKIFKEYIIQNNIVNGTQLAKKLNVSPSETCKFIKKYNLNDLMNYTISTPEKEIQNYINQYYKTENNVKLLDGKEIDIYIPEKKIGIEFNGNYWHSEKIISMNYHQNKSLLAEEKGIFLYHIFEYEWNNKKEQVINQLNNLLGINQEKIYARKCIIKEVSNEEKVNFLNKNHLQGNDISSINLGLYCGDELVSLMTFVKPRFNKNYQWELSRFCSKAGCNVIGGASKLFKFFINNYNPESIISYSNIAHTRGNLYNMLGFELKTISSPNYIWFKNSIIKSRYQCQKHKLLEQGYTGNSESDIMHNLGYYRIFDCGNKVWCLNNK